MSLIQIDNLESASTVRAKINALIDRVNGMLGSTPVATVSTSSTLERAYDKHVSITSVASATITLWATPEAGDRVTLINYSGESHTIDGNGNDIKSGSATTSATAAIANDEVLKFIYDGTNWLLTT